MSATASFEIQHVSRYRYSKPALRCVMSLCMMPRDDGAQALRSFEVTTDPPASLNAETDAYGNIKHVFNIHREHASLEITARSRVDTRGPAPLPGALGPCAWDEVGAGAGSFEGWEFSRPSVYARPSPALSAFVERRDVRSGADPLQSLLRLSDTLHDSFDYAPGSTSAISPIDHILESGRGVCQDYAHVMIAIARSWGVPARYVSGYVFVSEPDGERPDSQSHAWVECMLPGLGWVGFDPTNRMAPDERHVRVAVGRDYHDAAPTRGVVAGGGEASLEVFVRMRSVG